MTHRRLLVLSLVGLVGAAALAGGTAYGLAPARIAPSLPPPSGTAIAKEHPIPFGRIRPERPLPPVGLTLDDGTRTDLATLTGGHWTVAQLMFAGCTSTCPIQGAIFERTAAALSDTPVRLLSITIDPIGDTPAALKSWLGTFAAGPNWRAAVPDVAALGPLVDSLEARGNGIDVHGAAAFLIDPDGRLAYVTENMPSPETIASVAREAVATRPAGS